MENDYSKLWEDSLAMIREKYGDKFRHWYDVWFGDVRFESYDPDTHMLLVQVPSKYVYEFQEMNGAKDIRWATKEVFKTDIILKYRILEPRREPDFAQVADYLRQQGCTVGTERPHFRIADAEWPPGSPTTRVGDWSASVTAVRVRRCCVPRCCLSSSAIRASYSVPPKK